MSGEAQRSARKLKAALVARMHDPTSSQHQDGLLRAIQLCEKFINANAASMEAYSVLKEEVAKAMLAQQQGKARPQAASPSKTGSFKAGAYSPTSSQKAAKGRVASAQQQQRAAEDIFSASPVSKAPGQLALTTAAMIHRRAKPPATVFSPDLDAVPTLLLEHKAHLTESDFDRIVKLQDRKAQDEDKQWQVDKMHRQQHLHSQLGAQMAEREAQREAQRQAKLQEVQETNEALAAAYQADVQEMQQRKAAQQRQWNMYRQQQEEAEAVEQAEADAAAREQLIERAELQAAEAADAAAAAARAAANKAKLEVFKAEAAAGLEAKRREAAAKQEQERRYVEECKKAMDAAEAKRLADQEAWRQKQQAKYLRAGGVNMERKLEQDMKEAAEKTAREAAEYEAKQAAAAAARKAAEKAAAQRTVETLKQQMAEHEDAERVVAAGKAADAITAIQQRAVLEAATKAEKQAVKKAKEQQLQRQRQELTEWRQRKFDELNAPLSDSDKWVHKDVLTGQKVAFTSLKDNRRI